MIHLTSITEQHWADLIYCLLGHIAIFLRMNARAVSPLLDVIRNYVLMNISILPCVK